MKVIPKLQQGNTIESDNTKVVRPEIHEPIKAKPKQYSIVDLGGEPSNDTRSAAERNRDYWHPIKGAKARFRASMSNETNPLVGIERTILPSAAGAALVTTPAAVVGGALGNMTVDKLTGGWGNWLEDKTGIPSEIGIYTNPGAWYGGAKGYKIGKDKLITKSIKGDADLAWNPINKNHWIFNKEARTPSNIAMATANRITPFLSKVEKLPLKVAAYKAAKRTNGNASVSLQDIKTMPADYTGSSILGGGNLEGRNLLAKYIFDENPVVKRMFFNKATSNIKPISRNEARRGFSHGDRYEQLYPGVHNRRYEMSAVVPSGRPLKFENVTKFTDYAGKNPISKVVGNETEPVMRMGDKEFMTFRQPGTDYIGPIDDVAGHLVKFQMNKGKLRQTSQDMWKFNPADYAKRWNDSPNTANQVRLTKQAALMDKVGRPFILQQSNPIWIEGKSVRNPELVTMAHGGRFDFKKSPLLKKQEEINGKRDMRKKFIKSSRPTYKKRIKKAQQGMKFVSYNPVSNPTIDYTDITNPINPFSEYNYNTTYDKPEALVVPVRDTNETDVVANNPTVEPVINKPVASKVTYTPKSYKGLAAFNKAYDEVEASNPEAKKYRQFLTKMAEQESGFNSAIQNRAGAPAYGYFQFMQDDKKYNNIRQYAGTDIETFRNNPKLQIEAAIRLAKSFEKGFSKEDLELANKNGYSTWGLLGGAWLAGNGGVRKFLRGQGNPSDRHWSKEGKGTDVATRIKAFNFKEGGIVKYQEPAQPINRRDAIRDYRPNIPNRIRRATPAEHIQSMINIYGQSEQPIVTSDAKSPWQHQQAHEAASKGYDDYMQAKKYEEGLHNLNGILTFTDYATLATGLGSLLNKGVSYAGKRLIKKEIRNAMSTSGSPIKGSAAKFNISKESLPDYAKPNWQGDELALTKERLANGGFDRLEQFSKYSGEKAEQFRNATGMGYRDFYPFENDFGKTYRQYLLDSKPAKGTRADFKVNEEFAAFSDRTRNIYTTILDDAPDRYKNPKYRTAVEAHEFAHFAFNPQRRPPLDVYNPPLTNPHRDYLLGLRDLHEYGTELTARGTQIKNYFGLDKDKPITEDMLKYAADNYVKDKGFDNNMTDFFSGIKNYKEMAKWLSELSPMLALPLLNY
mgnify:CR=1 FL=1